MVLTFFYRKSFLLPFLQSPATCSFYKSGNPGVICPLCFYFDELSIYKWTEPWNIKGRFPESWGLRASVSSSPLPLPLQPFFCFRSTFRAITGLETLATQANVAWSFVAMFENLTKSMLHMVCPIWKFSRVVEGQHYNHTTQNGAWTAIVFARQSKRHILRSSWFWFYNVLNHWGHPEKGLQKWN